MIFPVTEIHEQSEMAKRMDAQSEDLRRLLADEVGVARVAEHLAGREVLVVGTGTSWHAANHAVWLLRGSSIRAQAAQAIDAALYELWRPADAVLILSHRNTKRFTTQVREDARAAGKPVFVIGSSGSGSDLDAGEPERSSAFTGSHLATLMRLAQIARLAGADLGNLDDVPNAVAEVLESGGQPIEPPARLLEFIGASANQWTAAEGALKTRETAYVATEGLSVEQFLHGPAVALDERDVLVVLDGGGPASERLTRVGSAAELAGARVHHFSHRSLGERLSVFPLTVSVQRVALELALALGTNPDSFRAEEKPAWKQVGL